MTYQEAIDWLFVQFPSYQNVGKTAYKPSLDNILNLVDQLNLDYNSLNFVHVAGTNGKGSTSSFIASALTESGKSVGLFTSPHIHDFKERIRVDGASIDEQTVVLFTTSVKENFEKLGKPSFFEITFAMALHYFLKMKCDIVVLETGLGGRLDATNIVKPLVSVITNIGLDHIDILGDSLEKIAFEKAGIIKRDTPVCIGEYNNKTLPVFQDVANEKNAPLIFSNFDGEINYLEKNKILAINVLKCLSEVGFISNQQDWENGLLNLYKNTGLKGRMQVVHKEPCVIFDAAHNLEGIKATIQSLEVSYNYKSLYIIYGAAQDKDHISILKAFPNSAKLFLTTFDHPRSWTETTITELISQCPKKNIKKINDPKSTLNTLKVVVNQNDMILVCGSFFLLEKII